MGEGDGGQEEFFDSDYESEEDKNEEEGRDEGTRRIEEQIVEDTSDSSEDDGEVDVVENDGDLDEGRDSEGEGPSNPVFNPEETYDPTFEIGMLFSNKKEFKKALQSYAIKTKRTVKFTKNDKVRIYAQCGNSECGWKMHAIKIKDEETFQINLLQSHHSCPEIFHVKNMKTNWLKDKYLQKFKSDPKRCVKGFRVDIINELRVNVSKNQAYRAKKAALKEIEGSPEWQYSRLWAAEMRNEPLLDYTVIIGTDQQMKDERFNRFYVCFGALKKGFQSGCRPIIGVDGCHLKGPHGGILLTAIGVDPNNNLFPIAYAVVNKECRETWEWFLIVLKHDLNIVRDYEFTFMSDKQKGLMQALEEVFPGSDHRCCVRHLHNNFKHAGFRGQGFKIALWNAAKACTVGEWKMRMQEMKNLSHAAHDWFTDKPAVQWSRSHFSEISICDMLLNNVCETFNACILDAREKLILTMLEWIREYLMRRMQENRDRCATKWKNKLCPKIQQILQKQINKISDCMPIKADDQHYQVSCFDGSQHVVDLGIKSCSCRKWQLSGIPCKHACCAIYHQKHYPVDYVAECYSVETYKNVYAPAILPMSHEGLWSESYIIPPLPPNFGRGAGRPAKARRRESDEPTLKNKKKSKRKQILKIRRHQTTIHCRTCGEPGHNTSKCPERMPVQEGGLADTEHEHGPHNQTVGKRKIGEGALEDVAEQSAATGGLADIEQEHGPHNQTVGKRKIGESTLEDVAEQSVAAETEQPTILPPLQALTEDEHCPEACVTQDEVQFQAPIGPVYVSGPSMYQQLAMSNPQPRVQIRAPPPFRGRQILPSFSTTSRAQSGNIHPIVTDRGKKFLDLSQFKKRML
ncbi:UNVERIFIED_CONTAM: hypothetical protein Sradi_0431000 [Sesamum radiatum]|uniref:CCHC-type domain-containing protein n=1 Tax=Sesamum radiatum TaxID=300843 RepID=A0AAW2WAV5_SESRA